LYKNHQVRRFLGGVDEREFSQGRFELLCSTCPPLIWAVRLKPAAEFIGMILLDTHHDSEDIEVSFQFLPESWGQGFATETVGAIIDYSRDSLNLTCIVAETQAANTRSRALLERLDMKVIRRLVRYGNEQLLYGLAL
jgi:ribosomal-protein-alanine N-acetyltransferase